MTRSALTLAAVLAAATTGASEGGGEGGLVSISPKLVILQIVNFAILVAAVYFIFRKWLLPGLQKRAEQVRRAIEDAERSKVEMERLRADYARQVEEVRAKAKEILDTAAQQSARDREEILHRARVEAQAAVDRAASEIERERIRVVGEIRKGVADLAVRATRQILVKEVDAATQRRIVDDFIASLDREKVGR